MNRQDIKSGQKMFDKRTGLTYTVYATVIPKGGNIAWIEAVGRRGHHLKISPDELGVRYAIIPTPVER